MRRSAIVVFLLLSCSLHVLVHLRVPHRLWIVSGLPSLGDVFWFEAYLEEVSIVMLN